MTKCFLVLAVLLVSASAQAQQAIPMLNPFYTPPNGQNVRVYRPFPGPGERSYMSDTEIAFQRSAYQTYQGVRYNQQISPYSTTPDTVTVPDFVPFVNDAGARFIAMVNQFMPLLLGVLMMALAVRFVPRILSDIIK